MSASSFAPDLHCRTLRCLDDARLPGTDILAGACQIPLWRQRGRSEPR